MTLDEYTAAQESDGNLFWRLDAGDHQNLLDEAVERLELMTAERDCWESLALRAQARERETAERLRELVRGA